LEKWNSFPSDGLGEQSSPAIQADIAERHGTAKIPSSGIQDYNRWAIGINPAGKELN